MEGDPPGEGDERKLPSFGVAQHRAVPVREGDEVLANPVGIVERPRLDACPDVGRHLGVDGQKDRPPVGSVTEVRLGPSEPRVRIVDGGELPGHDVEQFLVRVAIAASAELHPGLRA